MGQFMAERVRAGKPFWRTFFVGDTTDGGGPDRRTPTYGAALTTMVPAAVWGVTFPITLALSIAVGVWLMFAPAVFGAEGMAADSDRLVGALIVTVAAISTAEVVRALRLLNLAFALWLVLGPWIVTGATGAAQWNDVAAGLAVFALTLPRGPVRQQYAGWNRFVR